jgi:hypothetical protein
MTPNDRDGLRPAPAAQSAGRGPSQDGAHPPTGAAGEVPGLPGAQYVPVLRLAELVMAIVGCRQDLPLAAAAALVREPYGADTLVRVVFLDDEHEPLPANPLAMTTTTYVARDLDEDLAAAFGAKNVIILK